EELERLGHADRLVGGEKRTHVRVVAPHHLHDGGVLAHREAEATVLLRDLDPEGTELAETVHHVGGVLTGLVDGDRVDLLAQEAVEVVVELPELRAFLRSRREGMDVVEKEVPEEELAQEGPPRPLLLAGLLGDLPGLLLARRPCIHCTQSSTSLRAY